MENTYKFGDKLVAVGVDGIKFCNKGDTLIFVRKSEHYETDKGLMVSISDGSTHFIREDRIAIKGNPKSIKEAEEKAPKLHIILQDDCNNYIGQATSIESATDLASNSVVSGSPLTIYELKSIKKVSKDVILKVA